jgi:hypothetical protein
MKTTVWYHFASLGWQLFKKNTKENGRYWVWHGETGSLMYTAGGKVKWCGCYEK